MESRLFLRPFKYRPFYLLMMAEILYRTPIWMLGMVYGLMIEHYHPNSPVYQGMVGFLYNVPILLLTPWMGMLADRMSRIKILRYSQGIYIVASLCMVIWMGFNIWSIWFIFFTIMIYGIGYSMSGPALQAVFSDYIDDKKDLSAGLSVFQATSRICQFGGYALGGILYASYGALFCFQLSLGLYFIATVVLCLVPVKKVERKPSQLKPLESILSGYHYVKQHYAASFILIYTAIMGVFVWPYIFQMPILNMQFFNGTPQTLGYILGVGSVGSTLTSIVLTLRRSCLQLTHLLLFSLMMISAFLLALSLCHSVHWAMLILFFLDSALSIFMVCSVLLLQQIIKDEFRGRVMGLWNLCIYGFIPVGSLFFYGLIGHWVSLLISFRLAAMLVLFSALYFLFKRNQLRQDILPYYLQNDLLKEAKQIKSI